MPLIDCPNCGKTVSDGADVCIHCGCNLKSLHTEKPVTFFALPQEEQDKIKQEFNSANKELAKKYNDGKPPKSIIIISIFGLILFGYGLSPFIVISATQMDSLIAGVYLISGLICWFTAVVASIIIRKKLKKFTKNSVTYKFNFEKWLMKEKNLNVTWDLDKKELELYEEMKRSIN